MSEHTPGPWLVRSKRIAGLEGLPAAVTQGTAPYTAVCQFNWVMYQRRTTEEYEANARLIAAAPDLLALLEEAYDALPHGDLATRIAVLLAKAKGA